MWQKIKDFFSKPIVWLGLGVAGAAALALRIYQLNDFTRPAVPSSSAPRDYSAELQRLDPSRPVGVLLFNVETHGHWAGNTVETMTINAVRNNFIQEMRQHYGDNFIVVDDASIGGLRNFSHQFNERFRSSRPEVHFVANHHQNTYDDRELAGVLASVEASRKRALIMSCGPVSEAYRNLTGFDYVIIPCADGQIMGPDLSLRAGPAYRDAIGWMRQHSDPEAIRREFNQLSPLHGLRDRVMNFNAHIWRGSLPPDPVSPVIITPPSGIPLPRSSTPSR